MESREAWSALQSHLTTARARLDAGDYSAALDAVNAALAIDPAFLAAHSLRQRIELDRAKAAAPTGPTSATVAEESDPVPAQRAPAGRRFGVLLADVYERKRSEPAALVELQGHRTALPPPRPAPGPAAATQAEAVPAVAPPAPLAPQELVARPRDAREPAEDMIRLSESDQDPDFFDLRLNVDDEPDGSDMVADDWSRTTSRGPRLVLIGAVALVALIVGERPFHFEMPHFTSAMQFLDFRSAAVNPASEPEPLLLLTARRLENPPVELSAGGRSMYSSALAPRARNADVKTSDAPTIRSVTVSSPVSATTSTLSTTTAPPANETPASQREAAAVVPASAPASAVATPTPRTADAEPASYTRPAGETAGAAAAVAPSSAVDEQSVKTALQRYRNAYERLDAKSAQTVWPSVNETALARAFDSLQSQTLTFTTCDVDFRGPAAVATCEGSTKYTPRYGSHEPREEPRVWTFTLKKSGTEWKIDSVKAGR